MASLTEVLRAALDEGLSGVHTCIPARVESYDHKEQRASVLPLIKQKYRDGQVQSMPVIDRVPVVFQKSGGASLTFPVKKGDGVMLVFSERSMEQWLGKGGEQEPGDPRKFDLTDAIAIPGLSPFSEASPSTTNKDVELQYNGFRMCVNEDSRFAMGNSQEELLSILGELMELTAASICLPFSHLSLAPDIVRLRERLELIKGNLNPAATEG